MQFMLKLTVLGVEPHVFRVVSIEGQADTEHVMSLCDLAFDYARYSERSLYFAQDVEAIKALSLDADDADDDHYGPVDNSFAPFWQQNLKIDQLSLSELKLSAAEPAALRRFDELIKEQSAAVGYALETDVHPNERRGGFYFLYVVHGVQHLVEVLMCSEKLFCFIPATLMGEGLVVDDDPERPLSVELINESVAAAEAAEASAAASADAEMASAADAATVAEAGAGSEGEGGLNLKHCTSRMRAFGAMRSEKSMHQALEQSGASPLTIKIC